MCPPIVEVVGLAVCYPDQIARPASGLSRMRPRAEINLSLSDGGVKAIPLAVRAARALDIDAVQLPASLVSVQAYIADVETKACYACLLDMLSRRDYAIEEARTKLISLGFSSDASRASVAKAVDFRFLDDRRFAAYYIEERKRRGWGRRRIEAELRHKGISISDIPGYPDSYFDEDDDAQRAASLLERKRIPESRAYEKLIRFLLGKGFDYSTASRAVRTRLEEEYR